MKVEISIDLNTTKEEIDNFLDTVIDLLDDIDYRHSFEATVEEDAK